MMRKKNEKLTGTLRIVTVEGGDICTCCGTHPTRTGMVGLVRINRYYHHKDGSPGRIFVWPLGAGGRAQQE